MNALKRKLEKYKQKEWSAMSDEVMVEEIKTYRVRRLLLLRLCMIKFTSNKQFSLKIVKM